MEREIDREIEREMGGEKKIYLSIYRHLLNRLPNVLDRNIALIREKNMEIECDRLIDRPLAQFIKNFTES